MDTFIAVILVSLISLVGIFTLVFNSEKLKRFTIFLVSLAAGTLLGDVFFHIIPEVSESGIDSNAIGLAFVIGILMFFILEAFLDWHHCHTGTTDEHPHKLAINNLLADGLHNFLDGLIIASAFSVSTELGIATTIAVALHEIPQELGEYGILVHGGFKPIKALFFNFISALLALVGALIGMIFIENVSSLEPVLLSFAGGGFLYIAIADLLPEIKHTSDLRKNAIRILVVMIGIAIMYSLTFFE